MLRLALPSSSEWRPTNAPRRFALQDHIGNIPRPLFVATAKQFSLWPKSHMVCVLRLLDFGTNALSFCTCCPSSMLRVLSSDGVPPCVDPHLPCKFLALLSMPFVSVMQSLTALIRLSPLHNHGLRSLWQEHAYPSTGPDRSVCLRVRRVALP
mmetsp:Transcript_123521/g.214241  ORF Transcript_123521/g.214241 Transcript_123521/m.214241 type:complete len:153 (+) Transcript_123521:2541-2999(+)